MLVPNPPKFDACPRCDGKKVIDLGPTIECVECQLEFEKEEIRNAPHPSEALSIQEKMGLSDVLFGQKDED